MPEFQPTQPNQSDFEVQPQSEGSFAKLELVSDLQPVAGELPVDSKAKQQQVFAEMIMQVIALEDAGNYEAAKSLRDEANYFRDENGLEQVDESKLPGPDSTAAPDVDKHAA